MFIFQVNFFAVFIAALACFFLGYVWYSPTFFGSLWTKYATFQLEKDSHSKESLTATFIVMFIMSWFLAAFLTQLEADTAFESIFIAFALWLGFILPTQAMGVFWKQEKWQFIAIDAGYYLSSLLLSAIIISFWL